MSSYQGFPVTYETTDGVFVSVGAGVTVKVRAQGAGSDAAESPLTTNSNGEIPAGTLAAVSAGTTVHFRVENFSGLAGSISQVTT